MENMSSSRLLVPNMKSRSAVLVALHVVALVFSCRALAEVINVSDSVSFQAALNAAVPGHEIVLEPGIYPGRFVATGIDGVTIRSSDPNNRAVIDAAGLGEGMKLSSVKNLTISDLIIRNASANGMNIDDGGHVAPSENITLTDIRLENGSGDGIKLTGVNGFYVDNAYVFGWGGNQSAVNMIGSQNGVVERSYFENLSPANGTGVQTKGGAANIVIRANRFVNANERSIQIGGSTELSLFRPQPPGNVEASNIVAEGNVILNNGRIGVIRSAVSFINVGDGIFRNNVAYRPSLYFFRVLNENRNDGFIDTQNGTIADNIFLWNDGDFFEVVNAGSQTLPQSFAFEGNRWYNITDPADSQPALPSPETGGIYGIDPQVDLQGITPWDFSWGKWLVNTSKLVDSVMLPPSESYLLATPDAGGMLDVGAENPLLGSWTLTPIEAEEFTVQPFSYAVLLRMDDDSMPGDFNDDGHVDNLDYDVWKTSFGSTTLLSTDGNGNGIVDAADYTIWRDALVTLTVGMSSAVPEPSSALIAVCVIPCSACLCLRPVQQQINLVR